MECNVSGSTRVDLVGGTLDLYPISSLLKNSVTINLATTIRAKAKLTANNTQHVKIISHNYQSTNEFKLEQLNKRESFFKTGHFSKEIYGDLSYVCLLISHFQLQKGVDIELASDAPASSGLGGSSSMGVTLVSALAKWQKINLSKNEIIDIAKGYEGLILGQGIPGYQDYYPALYGGVLALENHGPKVHVEQLYSAAFDEYFTKNFFLVSSEQSRLSGMTNWEVYKGFFDGDKKIQSGLAQIADAAQNCYQALKKSDFEQVKKSVLEEGKIRANFFPGFVTDKMKAFEVDLVKNNPGAGIKVCGAGGGGCFLVLGAPASDVDQLCQSHSMKRLELSLVQPL